MVDNNAEVFDFATEKFSRELRKEVDESLDQIMGDMVVFELPEDMVLDFCEMFEYEMRLQTFADILKDRLASNSQKIVRAHLDNSSPQEVFDMASDIKLFESDKEAYDYFKCLATWEARHKSFVLKLRTAMDNFTHKFEVRQGFKVVRLGKKYSL